MSQKEVYDILKSLGGEATTKQISDAAKQKFPDLTLHTYVHNRLRKLEKNDYVERRTEENHVVWRIVAEYH